METTARLRLFTRSARLVSPMTFDRASFPISSWTSVSSTSVALTRALVLSGFNWARLRFVDTEGSGVEILGLPCELREILSGVRAGVEGVGGVESPYEEKAFRSDVNNT